MKLLKTISFISVTLFLSACTIKTMENNNRRTVSVSGTGTVEVEADNATIILSVNTRGKDVLKASEENAQKMTKVQDAVVNAGISKENISTQRYTVYQESNYSSGRSIPGDYVVSNNIKIFVKDLSLTSAVIDSALKSGANELSSLEYGISKNDVYVKQARTLAVQNAHDTANLIVTTDGAMLGKLISINEHQNNYGVYRSYAAKNLMADAEDSSISVSTPVNAGKSTISFTVDAVYEIK
ncbi:SIMPL domain-containing protein [Treponema pectinovorum]|uniref:SIMPL domain-containing protein n=1 Tax=Treponema pectinovorum TaxID=164 RepID=UPI0011C7B950|nr:SIMPL domain-containing protein [Treponema pectinovorum]